MQDVIVLEDECFVCYEKGTTPLYRVCNCNTLVHEQCYIKLVNVPSHASHCAVCRQQYKMDKTAVKAIRFAHKTSGWVLLIAALSFTFDRWNVFLRVSDDRTTRKPNVGHARYRGNVRCHRDGMRFHPVDSLETCRAHLLLPNHGSHDTPRAPSSSDRLIVRFVA